jgi:NAD(P)H-dependent FMN reductase
VERKIASLDAYIFVTPEYNHATSAALKNAIDFLYHEWNNKAAGFVIWRCGRCPSGRKLEASHG